MKIPSKNIETICIVNEGKVSSVKECPVLHTLENPNRYPSIENVMELFEFTVVERVNM